MQFYLPLVNPVIGLLPSYQNRSPCFRLANCAAMIPENVGPIGLPSNGVSIRPPVNRSMSSQCL
jgi:hypothetical protein